MENDKLKKASIKLYMSLFRWHNWKTLRKYFGLHNFILNWLVVNNFVSCLIKQTDLLTFMKELALFGAEKHDSIYNRISYLIEVKSGITCIFL